MNGFINNIISRYTNNEANIRPYLPGKFEPMNIDPASNPTDPAVNLLPGDITKTAIFGKEVNTNDSTQDIPVENKNIILPTTTASKEIDKTPGYISDPHNSELNTKITSVQDFKINLNAIDNYMTENNDHLYNPAMKNMLEVEFPEDHKTAITANENLMPGARHFFKDKGKIFQNTVPVHPSFIRKEIQNSCLTSRIDLAKDFGQPAPLPVIKVSIGRIEVRALNTPAPAKINREALQKPKMSLEAYLEKRNNNS